MDDLYLNFCDEILPFHHFPTDNADVEGQPVKCVETAVAKPTPITCAECRKSHVMCDSESEADSYIHLTAKVKKTVAGDVTNQAQSPVISPAETSPRLTGSGGETSYMETGDSSSPSELTIDRNELWRTLLPGEESSPPSLYVIPSQEAEDISSTLKNSGHPGITPELARKFEKFTTQLMQMRKFITPQQKENMRIDFEGQLEKSKIMATESDVPTIIWERSFIVHHVNRSASDLFGWEPVLPSKDFESLFRIFSKEAGSLIGDHAIRAHESHFHEKAYFRAGIRNVKDEQYRMANMVYTIKKDVLGLPQLYVLQILPDM
ncbi:hypothetical protein PROFUN_10253 [Planoprotostelium fungivorum]|uniref:PAS domain-containing protein n=1 Tax=Planoprotostelium fungivorum TaxID=1890364 RepID=A0A2P6NEG3_9EUKA|nr:hypothetical protein PROFUN_10253 [Planoprotostelium fungivorum]